MKTARTFQYALLCLAGLTLATGAAAPTRAADDWGTLTGRFVYEGGVVERKPLNITKDQQFCEKHMPMDNSLLVAEGGGLQNVIVYLDVPRRQKVDIHPDYESSAGEEAVIDNRGCLFEPRVVLMRTSQPLLIKNSDLVGHNTKIDLLGFNQIIPAEGELKLEANSPSSPLAKAMRVPSPVQCNIHPWMKGFLFVRDDPYMALSGEDGSFRIENIPAGTHKFIFWHELSGYLQGVEYDGGATGTRGRSKGRAEVEIADGQTVELGDIRVPSSMLQAGG